MLQVRLYVTYIEGYNSWLCDTYLYIMCCVFKGSRMTLDAPSFTQLILEPSSWGKKLVQQARKQSDNDKENENLPFQT